MDGQSLLNMKPSELAGQVGTVFQDPRSQFFMTDTTRELAFGCENLGLTREENHQSHCKICKKELELVDYLNRSILLYPVVKSNRLQSVLCMRFPQKSIFSMSHLQIWIMPLPSGLPKSWENSNVPDTLFLW